MIVLSGLLVAVAIVMLVIGLFGEGLGFVYASIVTSLVAGAFLILGALQRRGEVTAATEPAATGGTDPYERISAVSVTRPAESATADTGEQAAAAAGRTVSVVPGRPRYHTASCRFLAGRSDVSQVPVEQAHAEGYTACGVCKPDTAEAEEAAAAPTGGATAAEEATVALVGSGGAADTEDTDGEGGTAEEEPAEEAAPARRRTAAASPTRTRSTATRAAAKPATRPAAKTAAKAAAPARKTAAKAAEAAPAKPAKVAANKVVVIPDRPKYHTGVCRFVRDVSGTVTLTKNQAEKQGFTPCGVCKPA